jgi:hypothetical protein
MNYYIWSMEHGAYWRPNGNGYTTDRSQAGIYTEAEAIDYCERANQFVEEGQPHEAMIPVTCWK